MNSNTAKRRHVFIKKGFQKRFIAKMLLVVFLSNIIFGGLVFLIANGHIVSKMNSEHITVLQAFAESHNALVLAILIGSIVSFILSAILTAFIVTYSIHRIAGPLHKFEAACNAIGAGNLNAPVAIREGDELHLLSKAFIGMVESLKNQKMQRMKLRQDIRLNIKITRDFYLTDEQKDSLADAEKYLGDWEKLESGQK